MSLLFLFRSSSFCVFNLKSILLRICFFVNPVTNCVLPLCADDICNGVNFSLLGLKPIIMLMRFLLGLKRARVFAYFFIIIRKRGS